MSDETPHERAETLIAEIQSFKDDHPELARHLNEAVCGLEYTDAIRKSYTRLDDLGHEHVRRGETEFLEYILRTLADADELNGVLSWQTAIWDGCTIEELIGALIEADYLLASDRAERWDEPLYTILGEDDGGDRE